MKLGVLDRFQAGPGDGPRDTLLGAVELAAAVEDLGYARYWIAEHHEGTSPHAAPEVMAAVVAGTTSRIRVGSGGVLLRYRDPLAVAKSFLLLEALFPGRIDVGLAGGKAPPAVAGAFISVADTPEAYERRVKEVATYVRGQAPFPVPPAAERPPELWVLGTTSIATAALAGRAGAAFAQSLFLRSSRFDAGVIEHYRRAFAASGAPGAGTCAIAVAGICADTDAEARRIAARATNDAIIPTVVGDAASCAQQLEELRARFAADEVIFTDVGAALDERIRCYALLARAVGLTRAEGDSGERPSDDGPAQETAFQR